MTFDIHNILDQDTMGQRIARSFPRGVLKKIDKEDRIVITNKAVGELVRQFGYYPSYVYKEEMAKAIVKGFPTLGISANGVVEHAHFYCKETGGYIETRLKHLRKSLQPTQRKRKPNKKKIVRKLKAMRGAKDAPPFNLEEMNEKVWPIIWFL